MIEPKWIAEAAHIISDEVYLRDPEATEWLARLVAHVRELRAALYDETRAVAGTTARSPAEARVHHTACALLERDEPPEAGAAR